jgi:hypothetical protein
MSDFFIEILKGIFSIFLLSWPIFVILLFIFAWQNRRKVKWLEKTEDIVLEIKIPKTNDKSATAAEMMLATLHGILRPKVELVREGAVQEHVGFEFVSDSVSIRFYVWAPKHLKDFVEGQVYAQYPSAEINEVEDYSKKIKLTKEGKLPHVAAAEILLTKEDFLPIKTFNNFQVDPLAGITGVLSKLEGEDEQIWIQVLARPVTDEWKRRGMNWVAKTRSGQTIFTGINDNAWFIKAPLYLLTVFFKAIFIGPDALQASGVKLSSEVESAISGVQLKAEKLAYEVKIRVIYLSEHGKLENERLNAVFGAFKQYNTTMLNGFRGKRVYNDLGLLKDYQNRLFMTKGYHLNIEELASIYHLPNTSVETPNINWTTSKTGEPPTTLPDNHNTPEDELTLFAETNFRGHKQVFGIKRDDRRRHMYIIGKSGMGKSKLQELLIDQDIRKGEGVAVIDPHGDLVADVMKRIPEDRLKDVILFDPSDVNFPIAFNPMEVVDETLRYQTASGVLGTFKKIFGHSWGPRLEYVFNYTLLALLDTPDTTLLGVVRMLTDKKYRNEIIENIQDVVVKKFWTTEYASYSEKFATEAIAPILNKVGQFVANSLIRNIIGQPKSSFNIRKAMDEGKIILINLSSGKVGETNASLLGSFMVTSFQLAAMSRADIPEAKRKDFYLYVDEFQNFATESFATILSEARKYRLSLIMANQYIAQIADEGVWDAVIGNVGTFITFRVGAQDAPILEKEFNPPFTAQDIINLARQHTYIRMTIDGQSEQAFSAVTLQAPPQREDLIPMIIAESRQKYTKGLAEVINIIATNAGIDVAQILPQTPGQNEAEKLKEVEQITSTTMQTVAAEAFETPLVKKAGNKGGRSKTPVDKIDLKKIIALNTAHILSAKGKEVIIDENNNVVSQEATPKEGSTPQVTPTPTTGSPAIAPTVPQETPKTETVTPTAVMAETPANEPVRPIVQTAPVAVQPVTPEESPTTPQVAPVTPQAHPQHVKIKDKIDKEILSNILENVVKPKTGDHEPKPAVAAPTTINVPVLEVKPAVPAVTHTPAQVVNHKINSQPEIKKEHHKVEGDKVKFDSPSRREKIITPDNFKDVSIIHPHEVAKVEPNPQPENGSKQNGPAEFTEGDKIEF